MGELDAFLSEWQDTESGTKKAFSEIADHLRQMDDITLEFNKRPGITYSLRPKHHAQKERALFAMADVIDDNPEERWLSVCFYGDMITDPEEMGDLIPDGLLGDDGYCFDLDAYDAGMVTYIKNRLDEACAAAAGQA